MADAEAEMERMIGRYSPEVAQLGKSLITRMRARLPQANALVFDNYNAFGVGFSSTEKASGVILSVVLYPRWVNLFFFKGTLLEDPAGLLRGGGRLVRSIRLHDLAEFERPEVEALIAQALELAEPPLDPAGEGRLTIKMRLEKQRPRRPAS
jgi:hypothetical protein